MYFHEKLNFVKFIHISIRDLHCYDITDFSKMPPERATYKKLIKTKSQLLIGSSKYGHTFADRLLKGEVQ